MKINRRSLAAYLVVVMLTVVLSGSGTASAATTTATTASPTIEGNAGNVSLGDIWIFENQNQASSVFDVYKAYYITVTLTSKGVSFQTVPGTANIASYVEPLPPLSASNRIVAGDLAIMDGNDKSYTVKVQPSNVGGTRSGLAFHFPVNVSGAEPGPVGVEIIAPNTAITPVVISPGKVYQPPAPKENDKTNTASGTEAKHTASFVIGQPKYTIDGREVLMDAAPYIKEGRTFLPVRYVANALSIPNDSIQWDSQSQTVTITREGKTVVLEPGSSIMVVDGSTVILEVLPEIRNDRLCLPVSHVVDALGGTIAWNEDSKTVNIEYR